MKTLSNRVAYPPKVNIDKPPLCKLSLRKPSNSKSNRVWFESRLQIETPRNFLTFFDIGWAK